MTRRAPLWAGLGFIAGGLVVLVLAAAIAPTGPRSPATGIPIGPGAIMGGPPGATPQDPRASGFVPGTVATPRVIRIVATPHLRFLPAAITVKQGETVTFEVTTMGPIVHEFMVGPAADVAADAPGTPQIADIGMMETGSLTYTFDGPGPYAFACHAPGHYEAGMAGTIAVVP